MICPFPPPAPVQCVVDDVGNSGDNRFANHVDVIARNFSDDEVARRQRFPGAPIGGVLPRHDDSDRAAPRLRSMSVECT